MATYKCSRGHFFKSSGPPEKCAVPTCPVRVFILVEDVERVVVPVQAAGSVLHYVLFTVFFWLWPVLAFLSGVTQGMQEKAGTAILLTLCYSSMVVWVVFFLILLHRGWKTVQPLREFQRDSIFPTASTAVGYLFIPLFQLYWAFVAFVGVFSAMGDLIVVKKLNVKRPSVPLAIASTITVVSYPFLYKAFIWGCYIVEAPNWLIMTVVTPHMLVTAVIFFMYATELHSTTKKIMEALSRKSASVG